MPARFDLNQKDQPTLIRAVALLREQGNNVVLTLVGSGISEPSIRQTIQECKAASFVRLVAQSDDVPTLVATHNVLCLSTKFEGLPTVVIEGMFARRVVVASRVEGCKDIVRDKENGFLFKAGSIQDCADTLSHLQKNPDLPAIVEAAYQEALHLYTLPSMINAFEAILLS
jgi:glycosyltransferase involved in cell wall biosynthesis